MIRQYLSKETLIEKEIAKKLDFVKIVISDFCICSSVNSQENTLGGALVWESFRTEACSFTTIGFCRRCFPVKYLKVFRKSFLHYTYGSSFW